jgi:hypothetical protein
MDGPKGKAVKSAYKLASIGTRFKSQLLSLMETLSSTQPHYVRCIKPNSGNKPGTFENESVLHQLRCGVSRWCSHDEFYEYLNPLDINVSRCIQADSP